MSLDFTKVTHESMLEDWNNRILSEEQYKNLSQASIYSFFQEIFAGSVDLITYYIQRTAEENYFDTAKLDSSSIRLGHNLCYQPRRAVPAIGDISLNLRGPLPSSVEAGDTIWLNNESLSFTFNGHEFLLDACYSYTLTEEDVARGKGNPSWTKKIQFSVNGYENSSNGYVALSGRIDTVSASKLQSIRVFQGKRNLKVLDSSTYSSKIGKKYQIYDIDDVSFSNYYGTRDPFAFKNGEYDKRYGICKVGIGRDVSDAFSDSNLYAIEDQMVELSPEIAKGERNIVCLRSNTDKTVRMYFGNGITSSAGLDSLDKSIFVQYISTDGSNANYPDAVGSELRPSGKIYASGPGRVSNLSGNVFFLFESPVHGGQDFENRDQIERNAKLYFASRGQLITLPDYISYLMTLTDPITVKHAIAFGENQLEDELGEHDAGRTNLVMYTIFSDIYRKYNDSYRPVNVFDENEDLSGSCMYYNYEMYMGHLFDFVSFLLYPKGFTYEQYNDKSTFGTWCKQIRTDAATRMLMNTKLISMPPVFHYYDVVGDVLVDRHVDMSSFKLDLENRIYSWLSSNTDFKSQIFKSDITTKILSTAGAKRANIDIRVSDLIKGESVSHRFEPGTVSSNQNVLVIPSHDISGEDVREFYESQIGKEVTVVTLSQSESTTNYRVNEVSSDEEQIYLSLSSQISIDRRYYIDLVSQSDSLYSKGNLSNVSLSVLTAIEEWILSRATVHGSTQRPIELPYKISFEVEDMPQEIRELEEDSRSAALLYAMVLTGRIPGLSSSTKEALLRAISQKLAVERAILDRASELFSDRVIREETISRVGANTNDINYNLSEQSFYFMLMRRIENGKMSYEEAKASFLNVYPILKQIFDDNILDDNNNIVNFSSDRDIPVLRLRLNYKYA